MNRVRSHGPLLATAFLGIVFLSTPTSFGMLFPLSKVENINFPTEVGKLYREVIDFEAGSVAALLVDNLDNPSVWKVVQKRGTAYAETSFPAKVWAVNFSSNASTLLVQTIGVSHSNVVHVLNANGTIRWSVTVGAAHAEVTPDGSAVIVSTEGEEDDPGPNHFVRVYDAASGLLTREITFGQPLRGVVGLSSSEVTVAVGQVVHKYVNSSVAWSVTLPDEILGLAELGSSNYIASIHPMGRSRVFNVQTGALAFDFDPPTLATQLSLSAAHLRQLKPYGIPPGEQLIFFDPAHLSGTIVDVNLGTGAASYRNVLPVYPADGRPARQLFDGRLLFMKGNKAAFIDIRVQGA